MATAAAAESFDSSRIMLRKGGSGLEAMEGWKGGKLKLERGRTRRHNGDIGEGFQKVILSNT